MMPFQRETLTGTPPAASIVVLFKDHTTQKPTPHISKNFGNSLDLEGHHYQFSTPGSVSQPLHCFCHGKHCFHKHFYTVILKRAERKLNSKHVSTWPRFEVQHGSLYLNVKVARISKSDIIKAPTLQKHYTVTNNRTKFSCRMNRKNFSRAVPALTLGGVGLHSRPGAVLSPPLAVKWEKEQAVASLCSELLNPPLRN